MYGGMTRSETRALVALILLIAIGVGVHQFADSRKRGRVWTEIPEDPKSQVSVQKTLGGADTSTGDSSDRRTGAAQAMDSSTRPDEMLLDLNSASAEELSGLPLIGEKRAAAIVRLRESKGGFARVEDLLSVEGIGEKILARIRPLVRVSPQRTIDATTSPSLLFVVPSPTSAPVLRVSASPTPVARPKQIDINRANEEELQDLWNVGPTKAHAIVAWRESHGPFRSAEDLMQVPGIGPQTLNKNWNRIVVDSPATPTQTPTTR